MSTHVRSSILFCNVPRTLSAGIIVAIVCQIVGSRASRGNNVLVVYSKTPTVERKTSYYKGSVAISYDRRIVVHSTSKQAGCIYIINVLVSVLRFQ